MTESFGERVRGDLRIVCEPHNLRRTLRIASVVGTILFLINQVDTVVSGDATGSTWLKVGLTYIVPFFVANLGIIGARHDAQSNA